jgi:8-oxo-dGTP pyrophosphatase MutT (NUDIX family)
MRTEEGVILAVYKISRRNPRYLVLKRIKNWEGWEVPKGHLEENLEQTVRQELEEEAGIEEDQIEEIEDLEFDVEWSYQEDGEKVERSYHAFAVKVSESAHVSTGSNPHDEHENGFFLDFEDAKALLTYEDHQELLEKVHQQIG